MDITELLAFTAQQNASDLHLSAGLPPMIRVDGDVRLAIKLDSPSRGSDGRGRLTSRRPKGAMSTSGGRTASGRLVTSFRG